MKIRTIIFSMMMIFLLFFTFWNTLFLSVKNVGYSDFMDMISNGYITKVSIHSNNQIDGYMGNDIIVSQIPIQQSGNIINKLESLGANISAANDHGSSYNSFILFIIIGALFLVFVMYRNSSKNTNSNSSGSHGLSSIGFKKLNTKPSHNTGIKFNDIAGIEEIIDDLKEIVDFLKNPSKYKKLGSKLPRGILFVGDPGVGKTLLARALSSEADVPFFSVSGSDFIEMFAGVGASRVRELFSQAKNSAPCIIFIDEIDSIGRKRSMGYGGGHDEREQTLNQILVEMDGFQSNDQTVIVIGATNRPDILDHALLRPGRFDRKVFIDMPDTVSREKILNIHVKNIPLSSDIDLSSIAKGTPGFSGAELANLANEASILAARENRSRVTIEDFENAKDKIIMGSTRKSLQITEHDRKITAYHEAGHALVALFSKTSDPIHKVTIVPRSMALGMVVRLPERDKVSISKDSMHENIAVAVAGRLSEEEFFGSENITSGASSDITYATETAFSMVTKYGMSDKIGMVDIQLRNKNTGEMQIASNHIMQEVYQEINKIIEDAQAKVKHLIKEKKSLLIEIAESLLQNETLSGDEVRKMRDTYIAQNQNEMLSSK